MCMFFRLSVTRASTKNEETRVTVAVVAERIASLQLFAHSVSKHSSSCCFYSWEYSMLLVHCTIACQQIDSSLQNNK